MAALVGKRVRTTQPQSNAVVDWSNPVTQGLVFAYTCANEAQGWGEDGRNGIQYIKTSDGTAFGRQINTLTGTAGQMLSSSSAYLFGDPAQTSVKSGVYSLFAFGTGPSSGIQSAFDDDDGTNRRFQFRINAGKVELNPFYSGGNGNVIAPSAMSASDLASGFAMGAVVNGTAYAIYQKGVKTAGTTLSSTALTPNSTIRIGARKTGAQHWLVGGLSLVVMWNRALYDAEQQSLADNPWQLFKPAPRRLWLAYSASSGTTTDVSPAAAALALTGYAPQMAQSANQAVAPGAGSITVAGYAPAVTQSVTTNVSPTPGALTLAGNAPQVAQSSTTGVSPQAGALTLAGSAPTLVQTANVAVAPDLASIGIAGYAPAVTQSGPISLTPGSGALGFAGYAPDVSQTGASAQGGGSSGSARAKRKYVVRRDDQLYVFTDPTAAEAFLYADDEPPPKQYPAKKQDKRTQPVVPKPVPVPEQRVNLEEVRALAERQRADAEFQQLMAQRRYDAMLVLLERLREDEEDDWLLMAAG